MKKRLKGFLRVAVLVYLGVLILLVALERFLVYPAPPRTDGRWNAAAFNLEDVEFQSADGTRLHGVYADHPAPVAHVLFCHGNGEHVGYLGDTISRMRDEFGIAIFAFDYRGYGKSGGKAHEEGVLADGEAAQRWLATRAKIKPEEVVIHGRSLGGGVAVYLASSAGARALIVERTFHSMVEIGVKQYPILPVRWLMRNRYPSSERIASYTGPLLQLHGTADRLIPIESSRELHKACPSDDKQFIEAHGMGHNDPSPREFYEAFRKLLNRLRPVEPSSEL